MSTVYNASGAPVDLTGGRVIAPHSEAKNVRDEELGDRERDLADSGVLVITTPKRSGAKKEETA